AGARPVVRPPGGGGGRGAGRVLPALRRPAGRRRHGATAAADRTEPGDGPGAHRSGGERPGGLDDGAGEPGGAERRCAAGGAGGGRRARRAAAALHAQRPAVDAGGARPLGGRGVAQRGRPRAAIALRSRGERGHLQLLRRRRPPRAPEKGRLTGSPRVNPRPDGGETALPLGRGAWCGRPSPRAKTRCLTPRADTSSGAPTPQMPWLATMSATRRPSDRRGASTPRPPVTCRGRWSGVARMSIQHDPPPTRFFVEVPGGTARAARPRTEEHTVDLLHTTVPVAASGKGIAGQLSQAAFDWARASGTGLVVHCPYITRWLERHPEQRDLVRPP